MVAVNQLDEKVSLFRTRTAYNRFSHRARIKTFTALFKQDKFGFKIDLVPGLSARRRGRPRVWPRRWVCTGGCRPGGTAAGTGWRAAGRSTQTLGAWWWPGWTGRGSGCTWLGSTSPGTHGSRLGYQLYQVKENVFQLIFLRKCKVHTSKNSNSSQEQTDLVLIFHKHWSCYVGKQIKVSFYISKEIRPRVLPRVFVCKLKLPLEYKLLNQSSFAKSSIGELKLNTHFKWVTLEI